MPNLELWRTIVNQIGVSVREQGFKRRSQAFSRAEGDVIQQIHLQRSRYPPEQGILFTVNVAILSLPLAESLGQEVVLSDPFAWHWHMRLGTLMPIHRDEWWTVPSVSDVAPCVQEITESITRYALPAFGDLHSTERLLELWQEDDYHGLSERQRWDYIVALGQEPDLTREQSEQKQQALHDQAMEALQKIATEVGGTIIVP